MLVVVVLLQPVVAAVRMFTLWGDTMVGLPGHCLQVASTFPSVKAGPDLAGAGLWRVVVRQWKLGQQRGHVSVSAGVSTGQGKRCLGRKYVAGGRGTVAQRWTSCRGASVTGALTHSSHFLPHRWPEWCDSTHLSPVYGWPSKALMLPMRHGSTSTAPRRWQWPSNNNAAKSTQMVFSLFLFQKGINQYWPLLDQM